MRLLIIGDSLGLTTGFANVIRHIAQGAMARGWEVGQLASLDAPPFCNIQAFIDVGVRPFFPDGKDQIGLQSGVKVVERFRPDCILLNSDPGMAHYWFETVLDKVEVPVVLYAPVEGAPINGFFAGAFSKATRAFTYTKWAKRALAAEYDLDVEYVWHGVDPFIYHPLPEASREDIRDRLGWTGKYVVTYVARNSGRKAHDRLIKAMAHLKGVGEDEDVHLYLHTQSFDGFWNQGWDLDFLAQWCEVTDRVSFMEDRDDATRGLPDWEVRNRLAASDLLVHPAKVEGFGLPLLEAMACGLPVVVTADGGNMMEVVGASTLEDGSLDSGAALGLLHATDFDTWHTGAQLANVSPETIAFIINQAKRINPVLRAEAIRRGLERAAGASWEKMTDTLLDGCLEAVQTAEETRRWKQQHANGVVPITQATQSIP